MEEKNYNDMQMLKRNMFAMRNGVIADVLRKAGSPFSIIFGLNLPQLAEIAAQMPNTVEFAEKVWANATTRESMMIAPMLMPKDQFDRESAMRWIDTTPATEVADIVCLKLLKHMPFAMDLVDSLVNDENDMRRYYGVRLMCNLAPTNPQRAVAVGKAEIERNCSLTRQAANILLSYEDMQ